MSAKHLSRLTMFVAISIVLRIAFGAFPNIKPISAIFFLLATYFSLVDSLIVMALTMTITGFLMGFGPWIWWQICSYTVLLIIWGILRRLLPLDNPKKSILGAVLAGSLALSYGALVAVGESWQFGTAWFPYWVNGFWFDILHGISTFFFYPILHYIFWRLFTHEKNIDRS